MTIQTESAGDETAAQVGALRRWRVHAAVAWVEGEGRVAILDLLDPQQMEPLLCPDPLAGLWRAVAAGPKGEGDLLEIALAKVGGDAAQGLLDAFLEAFAAPPDGRGLVEEAT
ncbi:MAG: hypothetical protein L0H31_08825 [Nocardioidaceae bacterium]|nr:hypothetical protein [Nocardioidaceae bacterium]